jgi:methylenetetrahydrofolate reductase (NADPH)
LRVTRAKLAELKPEFFSVTYGAGGSARERTFAIVREIAAEGLSAAPHLSCIGSTKESIRSILDEYRAENIRRIVALRGDLPSGMADAGEFRYANELVEFIRAETGDWFSIEVAAYPEWHPQARSARGRPRCLREASQGPAPTRRSPSISTTPTPISISSMQSVHKASTSRSSPASCRSPASPSWLAFPMPAAPSCRAGCARSSKSFGDDAESIKAFGLDVVTELCERLLAGRRAGPALLLHEPGRADDGNLQASQARLS